MLHKTKIIATVGPACNTFEKLLALVQEGVNVFRLNFSHGSHEQHKEVIDHIKKINEGFPFNIAILADLQGPKLRVGEIENNALPLKVGDSFYLTNEKCVLFPSNKGFEVGGFFMGFNKYVLNLFQKIVNFCNEISPPYKYKFDLFIIS